MSSASGGRSPTGALPWTPLGDFHPPDPLFCAVRKSLNYTMLTGTHITLLMAEHLSSFVESFPSLSDAMPFYMFYIIYTGINKRRIQYQ